MLTVQAPAADTQSEQPAIVVTASRRGRCRIRFAGKPVSDRQLDGLAREWAELGRPVSVVRPRGANYKCLAKIVFRLNHHGVRLVHFADPDEPPGPAATLP